MKRPASLLTTEVSHSHERHQRALLALTAVALIATSLFILFMRLGSDKRARVSEGPLLHGAVGRPSVTGSVRFAGWAMEAYPGDSLARLAAEMKRQVRAGANVVWLGHNNPGEVGYRKLEPGLSYAVWAAYSDRLAYRHGEAVAMVEAQRRALEAARTLGVRVVLPVGYQIQMGQAWNGAHPDDLRRASDGTLYDASGGPNHSASFYAPSYRHDILAYYRWIERSFVRPFARTILMLNLADEPQDGDYSAWAERAFRAHHGYGLLEAGDDPARQEAVGHFESDYIAEYAAWSARQWQRLDPSLRVTMSFCGGYSRSMHEGPDLESVFRATPANFTVTFDAYPRDGLYDTPLRQGDITALFLLVRTLGYYSARYHHPLWLWSAANSWGLNEASPAPGNVSDAVANGIYLAMLARQTGGDLQGIAVWNYNVRRQGLYGDTHRTIYAPDTMFVRVSDSFALLRSIMQAPAGNPDTVILAPNASALRSAGAQQVLRASDPYWWDRLDALAGNNVAAVSLTNLSGIDLRRVRGVLVLARNPDDLAVSDRATLLRVLAHGGAVLATRAVARALVPAGSAGVLFASAAGDTARVSRIDVRHGTLLAVDGSPVENVFSNESAIWAAPLWRMLFPRIAPPGSDAIAHGGAMLLYSLDEHGASVSIEAPQSRRPQRITVYRRDGSPLSTGRWVHRPHAVRVKLGYRQYALVLSPRHA